MLETGQQAPAFTVESHTGETIKLGNYRGKRVLLWFYPVASTPG
jgi:peroxiredoxin Q/BCP